MRFSSTQLNKSEKDNNLIKGFNIIKDEINEEAVEEEEAFSSENINTLEGSELAKSTTNRARFVRPKDRCIDSKYLFQTNQDSTMFKSGNQ